ncbi:hypothetical protein K2E96_14375 [Pseudomonas sp. ERGC3:05]|nr:hypothetical protein [Pseudomonas sp. ERGC3:01]QZC96986.1 hypothetical protein K2E96_14375 [Pseudomonas sp. ERGC3:05]
MSDQEFLSEYGRLVRNIQEKAAASNRFTTNDDPNRPGRDEQFAQVQHDLKEAMIELEDFWRKFHAGEFQVG